MSTGDPNTVVALAGWLAMQTTPPRGPLMLIALLNLGWAVGCLWLAFGSAVDPTAWGVTYLLVQAMAVFVLAELEWMGWRQLATARRLPFAA